MIEPVAMQDFVAALVAGAGVVVAGAAYALLFAVSRVYRMPRLLPLAYLAYALLALAVVTLSRALHFSGWWQVLTYMLLLGYLLAPHGIWHLTVATHAGEDDEARAEID
jgi:hypothetical protein